MNEFFSRWFWDSWLSIWEIVTLNFYPHQCSSVQLLSCVWLFGTLWIAACQAWLPCPSPTPGVYSDSCPLSQWCHPTISSSFLFSSCPQSFPASGSFQMSQFFSSGGQSIGVSASASVLPMNSQDWSFWIDWLDLLTVQGTVFSNTTVQKHQFFGTQLSLCPALKSIHDHWKNHSFD